MTPLRARLAAAAPGLDDATMDALERAALPAIVWSPWKTAHIGKLQVGAINRVWARGELWSAFVPGAGLPTEMHPTEAAAREALERAVIVVIYGQ